jgi:hypothetical protein
MSQQLPSGAARILVLMCMVSSLGCSSGPSMKPFDVTVQPQITHAPGVPASVEVNLVGVSDSDLTQWRGYSVNQYWSPHDPLRKSAGAYVMTFSTSDPHSQTLDRTNAIWEQWRQHNAMNLFIIAFLPSIPAPADAATDPRKLELPLDRRRWGDVEELHVVLENSGLKTDAAPHEP